MRGFPEVVQSFRRGAEIFWSFDLLDARATVAYEKSAASRNQTLKPAPRSIMAKAMSRRLQGKKKNTVVDH